MKPIENWEEIDEAGEFKPLPAGIYPLQIKEVIDVPEREYFDIHFDIVKGDYKGYYSTSKNGYGSSIRSYKTNALPFFKAFITAVEKTNNGYTWNWDEKTLAGKYIVGVFGEEEYIQDNEVKVGTKLVDFRSKQAYEEGKIKVPEKKLLTDEEKGKLMTVQASVPPTSVFDDELPF